MSEYIGPKEDDPDQIATKSDIDGLIIDTSQLADDAVTTDKIAADAITATQLAENSVFTNAILPSAVATDRIADLAVTAAKIASEAVSFDKLSAISQGSFLARSAAGKGDVAETTASEARTLLNVEDGATVSLAGADQVLTGARSVTNTSGESLSITLTDGAKTSSLFVTPANPNLTFTANDGAGNVGALQVGSTGMNVSLIGTAEIKITSVSSTAGQALTSTGWADVGIARQATAPATTALWFHTGHRILYEYDSTRSKWLSVQEYTVEASTTLNNHTATVTLQMAGNSVLVQSDQRGWPFPHDATVTGWTWRVTAATSSRALQLGRYDTSASSHTFSAYAVTPSSWTEFTEDDLDVDFDAEDTAGLRAVGSVSMSHARCVVVYRRRAS